MSKKSQCQLSILSRLYVCGDNAVRLKYHQKIVPFSIPAQICYISLRNNVFAVHFDQDNDEKLVKQVHEYYAAKPIGEHFSGLPTTTISPSSLSIGRFAGAYIDELRQVCRVQILCVNTVLKEAEVLAIDVGIVAKVPICLLFALPKKFTRNEFQTALALVCKLSTNDKKTSQFLSLTELDLNMVVFLMVLSTEEPCLVACINVCDRFYNEVLLTELRLMDVNNFQRIFENTAFSAIDRRYPVIPMSYACVPFAANRGTFIATVINVMNIRSIYFRDFYSSIRLIRLQQILQLQYKTNKYRFAMQLLPNEVYPGMGVVFVFDNTYYRGSIIASQNEDSNIRVDAIDYPGNQYVLPLEDIFHAAPELICIPPLTFCVNYGANLSEPDFMEKSLLAAAFLIRGMVVDVTIVPGSQPSITLPDTRDLQDLLDLPCSNVILQQTVQKKQAKASTFEKVRKMIDASLHTTAVDVAQSALIYKQKTQIQEFEALTKLQKLF